MAYAIRQKTWQDELWNVSLLPTVKAVPPAEPPRGPGPAGGQALGAPALLSISEPSRLRTLPRAA
jgi:hypothetical protein